MVKRHSNTSRAVESSVVDNFQLIKGIGPSVERRLHGVGVYTFVQLAGLTPADVAASVADLPGFTAESIMRQDWLGQAHALASKSHVASTHQHSEPSVLVEHAPHLEKPREETVAAPGILESEPPTPVAVLEEEPAKEVALAQNATETTLAGILHLRAMEFISAHDNSHASIVRSSQTFKVRVTLDLTEVIAHPHTVLFYKATIFGKQLGENRQLQMGETQGTLPFEGADTTTVEVEGMARGQGIYRLEIIVSLYPQHRPPSSIPGLIAIIQGGPLHFY